MFPGFTRLKIALADFPLFQQPINEGLDQGGIKLVTALFQQFLGRCYR